MMLYGVDISLQREAESDNSTCTMGIQSAKPLSCFCMELGKSAYWQFKISTTTMSWRQENTRIGRAFPTITDHLRSSKILWLFYKTTVKKMRYCYLDAFQGINVMTSKYFHQVRVKRYLQYTAVIFISFLILDHLDILQRIMSDFQGVCSSHNILFILVGTPPIHCCGATFAGHASRTAI